MWGLTRYAQVQGVDFMHTFSPMAKMTTLQVLLPMAFTFTLTQHRQCLSSCDMSRGNLFHDPRFFIPSNPTKFATSTNNYKPQRKQVDSGFPPSQQ